MTPHDLIRLFAENWKHLRAWGRPLVEVEIKIVDARQNGHTGYCRPAARTLTICAGRELASNLDTALHELAHCAAPADTHHGPAWREAYAMAVQEVTGIGVPGARHDTYAAVRALGVEALREWTKTNASMQALVGIWKATRS